MVECLPTIHDTLGSILHPGKEVQGPPWLYREFEGSLNYMSPCLNIKINKNKRYTRVYNQVRYSCSLGSWFSGPRGNQAFAWKISRHTRAEGLQYPMARMVAWVSNCHRTEGKKRVLVASSPPKQCTQRIIHSA